MRGCVAVASARACNKTQICPAHTPTRPGGSLARNHGASPAASSVAFWGLQPFAATHLVDCSPPHRWLFHLTRSHFFTLAFAPVLRAQVVPSPVQPLAVVHFAVSA